MAARLIPAMRITQGEYLAYLRSLVSVPSRDLILDSWLSTFFLRYVEPRTFSATTCQMLTFQSLLSHFMTSEMGVSISSSMFLLIGSPHIVLDQEHVLICGGLERKGVGKLQPPAIGRPCFCVILKQVAATGVAAPADATVVALCATGRCRQAPHAYLNEQPVARDAGVVCERRTWEVAV